MQSEIGSGGVNTEDDHDPAMVAKDENKNAEKPTLVSSNDIRTMCANSGRIQLGSNHPLGITLSENIFKEGIGIKQNQVLQRLHHPRWSTRLKSLMSCLIKQQKYTVQPST